MNFPRFHSGREELGRSASQASSSRGFGRQGIGMPRSSSNSSLTRSDADPRNWFLSSQRREYNLTGKTRKEREQFQTIPSLPTQNFTVENTCTTFAVVLFDFAQRKYSRRNVTVFFVEFRFE